MSARLACPRDHGPLEARGDELVCREGHAFPLVGGVPVLVDPELEPTLWGHWSRPEDVERIRAEHVEAVEGDDVDPYVARLIVGTHGNLYRGVGPLHRYPIPQFPSIASAGSRLLDVGCNWGRWSLAAGAAGYDVTGVDPSFAAVTAARRIARQLDARAEYVVGDARRLPFADASFDVVFSYSVLQHFSRETVATVVAELDRVLAPKGVAYVQMTNRYGLRNTYNLARRRFSEGAAFDVRYWRPGELRRAFGRIGPTTIGVDGFFSLNPRATDVDLLPWRARAVVRASDAMRAVSRIAPPVGLAADSVWVEARKQ
jgi:SAM-dependent methyltransferase